MSAIAILDYAGAEALFGRMGTLAEEGRRDWDSLHQEMAVEATSAPGPGPDQVLSLALRTRLSRVGCVCEKDASRPCVNPNSSSGARNMCEN